MVAAAKALTPLLGPSGPACAMEMSYHIHSSPQGNPLPALGCPACTLPASACSLPPRHRQIPLPLPDLAAAQPCSTPSHCPGAVVSQSPMSVGCRLLGLWGALVGVLLVPTDSASPLVPGFLAVSISDHTTGTSHVAWHTEGQGGTAEGHIHVLLGERSRPFQVLLKHKGPVQSAAAGQYQAPGAHRRCHTALRLSCWHWWICRTRQALPWIM